MCLRKTENVCLHGYIYFVINCFSPPTSKNYASPSLLIILPLKIVSREKIVPIVRNWPEPVALGISFYK
jgi:hypothetical protein